MKEYFRVNVSKYVSDKNFDVVRPASINIPKDNAVMFVLKEYIDSIDAFYRCNNCLVFWPDEISIPNEIINKHAYVKTNKPKHSYNKFFAENSITYYPQVEEFNIVNGSFISKNANIGNNSTIMPGVYISGGVTIGDNCYIGTGTKLVGDITIGNNVLIRENTVIGADGLSTNRNDDGSALTMPQFGDVVIEDDVQIGSLVVIARGAIDSTIIKKGSKIDNSCFISHNVVVGENTFIVGESIMFGSSSTGNNVLISGNSTIRDGRRIGNNAIVGMGSVVVKNVPDYTVVKGNPAK